MKMIACWSCGSHTKAGRTCACGAYVTERHDPYVYDARRRWYWKCHRCGAEGGPFPRRMDADDSAASHGEGSDR